MCGSPASAILKQSSTTVNHNLLGTSLCGFWGHRVNLALKCQCFSFILNMVGSWNHRKNREIVLLPKKNIKLVNSPHAQQTGKRLFLPLNMLHILMVDIVTYAPWKSVVKDLKYFDRMEEAQLIFIFIWKKFWILTWNFPKNNVKQIIKFNDGIVLLISNISNKYNFFCWDFFIRMRKKALSFCTSNKQPERERKNHYSRGNYTISPPTATQETLIKWRKWLFLWS